MLYLHYILFLYSFGINVVTCSTKTKYSIYIKQIRATGNTGKIVELTRIDIAILTIFGKYGTGKPLLQVGSKNDAK